MHNIAIIGGGAAGFFAAIAAKEACPGCTVTIFERAQKVLSKVAITGGGRCNVTNSFENIADLKTAYPRGAQLIKRLFNVFNYRDAFEWFEQRGVPLVVQPDACVFPRSQDAQSIVSCLVQQARQRGVNICTGHRLVDLKPCADGRIELLFKDKAPRVFDAVAVTTGGSPQASGLAYLARQGHTVVSPVPSLFTFNIKDRSFVQLMGTVVPCAGLRIPGTKHASTGALLITHWGISGPATLKLSSYAARFAKECNYRFDVAGNWLNEYNAAIVEQQLQKVLKENARKQMASIKMGGLTERVWTFILSRAQINGEKRCEELGRKMMHKLIETLTNDIYKVEGKGAFKEEFVTCGGVSLSDIALHTLESKHVPNLYFAGEVLDIDAITDGFNLQAAWTTGFVAGQSMAQSLRKP